MKPKIAYIGLDPNKTKHLINQLKSEYEISLFENGVNLINWLLEMKAIPKAIVLSYKDEPSVILFIREIKSYKNFKNIPLIIISERLDLKTRRKLMMEGAAEIFTPDFLLRDFMLRVNFLSTNELLVPTAVGGLTPYISRKYEIPLGKRLFDIAFSLSVLILVSPLLALISLLIMAESRGPVFYSSKRVGTGYRIFDFYKFRSMSLGANTKLKDIAHLNQYKDENKNIIETASSLCETCLKNNTSCQSILYLDDGAICEKIHGLQRSDQKPDFIKINNDPRVTRVGQFLRNTSIDELPQLFNVLKGDMSLVGNRPLPLYEAEKLTTDQFTTRFLAPAGITGLWQVVKRGGSGKMSAEERIQLDNEYALNYSFKRDLEIILKTFPALVQKENV